MFRNFYVSALSSPLVNAAGNTFPNPTMKYQEKVWNLVKVNNEDTRGMSVFLNASMSMWSFWWIQLYVNYFQHLSFQIYVIWHDDTMRWTRVPPNVTRSTKLWGVQCSPEPAFRSTDFRVPAKLIFPALKIPEFFQNFVFQKHLQFTIFIV